MGFMVRMRSTVEVEPTSEDLSEFFERTYARLASACLLYRQPCRGGGPRAGGSLAPLREVDVVRSMTSPEGYLFRTALNLNRKRLRRVAVRARRAGGLVASRDEIEEAEEVWTSCAPWRRCREGSASSSPIAASRTLTALGK
jgi:hypothetical protein